MKRIMYAAVVTGMLIGMQAGAMEQTSPLNAPKISLFNRLRGWCSRARDKVSYYAVRGYVNEQFNRAHTYSKPVLGNSKLGALARVTLFGSLLFLGSQYLLDSPQGMQKAALGMAGWVFEVLGVDDFTVRGTNFASVARDNYQALWSDYKGIYNGANQTLESLTQQNTQAQHKQNN